MKKTFCLLTITILILMQNLSLVFGLDVESTTEITITITSGGSKKDCEYGEILFDYMWLTSDDKSVFNYKLAEFASVLANDIYKSTKYKINGTLENDKCNLLEVFGFSDVKFYQVIPSEDGIDPNDITDMVIGHKNVTIDDIEYEIYVIVIRGTNGTQIEWSSNFDVGYNDEVYFSMTGDHPDWLNKMNHKGFDVTANRVNALMDNYLRTYGNQKAEKTYLFTGHSRGAAVANILGAMYEADNKNSCAYTFSTPNTTMEAEADRATVFNVICEDDFICYLPLKEWGYKRYGKDISVNVGENEVIQTISKLISGKKYKYGVCQEMQQIFFDLAADTYEIYNWDMDGCSYKLSELLIDEQTINKLIEELNYGKFAQIDYSSEEPVLKISKAVYCISAAKGIELLGKKGGELELYAMGIAMDKFFPVGSAVKNAMDKSMSALKTNLEALMNPHRPEVTYSIIKGLYSPKEEEYETTEAITDISEAVTETNAKPVESTNNSFWGIGIGIGAIILMIAAGFFIEKKTKKS